MINLRKQRQKFARNSVMINTDVDKPIIQIALGNSCFKGHDIDDLASKDSLIIYNFLCSLLAYALRTLTTANATRYASIVVVIDSSRAPLKTLRLVLRACQNALAYKIRHTVVVAPERFLDHRRMSLDLLLESYDFKTTMCSRSKLWKHVDTTLLFTEASAIAKTTSEGVHTTRVLTSWSSIQEAFVDHFRSNPTYIGTETDDSCLAYLGNFCKREQSIMVDLNGESSSVDSQPHQHAATMPRKTVGGMISRSSRISLQLDAETDHVQMEDADVDASSSPTEDDQTTPNKRQLLELDERRLKAQNIVAWLSADCADALMRSSTARCSSKSEIEHQQDELAALTCQIQERRVEANQLVAYSGYTDDVYKELINEMGAKFDDIESRLQQSALKANTHIKFYEFYKEADALLKSLCAEPKELELPVLRTFLHDLDTRTHVMEERFEEAMKISTVYCGISTSVASSEEKSSDDVCLVTESVMHMSDRRRRCLGLSDMRRLKTQQLVQLRAAEQDARQVINWIDELILNINAGDPITKVAKFEGVAKKMQQYGEQLCSVSLLLRRSLRLEVQSSAELQKQLHDICRQFNEAAKRHKSALHNKQ